MSSIFLSHNTKDKPFARRLAAALSRNGIRVWIDEAEMRPGDSLLKKIADGIAGSRFLGVVLSPHALRSRWVQKELAIAATREIRGRSVKVIPILYRDCDVPVFLEDKLYIDFRNRRMHANAVSRLAETILPRNLLRSLFQAVRNAAEAEVDAYRSLPRIDTAKIDMYFTAQGSARRRILHLLRLRKRQRWVLSNPGNPWAHEILDLRLRRIEGGEAIVEADEYLYLRWFSKPERRYRYIYNERNRQTYILRREKGAGWKVHANIYPAPKNSRMLRGDAGRHRDEPVGVLRGR